MVNQTKFMIEWGNKLKETIIKDFNRTKSDVLANKQLQEIAPTSCRSYVIRKSIAKMKFLNAFLTTDIDCMQKEYEKYKSYASLVMEEYEKEGEEKECEFMVMDTSEGIYSKEGAYLYTCDLIKAQNDILEDFIKVAKNMKRSNLHF